MGHAAQRERDAAGAAISADGPPSRAGGARASRSVLAIVHFVELDDRARLTTEEFCAEVREFIYEDEMHSCTQSGESPPRLGIQAPSWGSRICRNLRVLHGMWLDMLKSPATASCRRSESESP
jgi:hypothetical protein